MRSLKKLRQYSYRPYLHAVVLVTVFVAGTLSASVQPSIHAAPSAVGTTCKVDPKHKKLQDQESNDNTEPWKRDKNVKQAVVYFAYGSIPAEYKADVIYSTKQWSKSACIEAKAVKSCPKQGNCTSITFKKSGGTNVNGSCRRTFEGGYITEAKISLNSTNTKNDKAAKLERISTIAHEMGHALGLDHRKKSGSLMAGSGNDDFTKPDKIDFQNLRVIYGNKE